MRRQRRLWCVEVGEGHALEEGSRLETVVGTEIGKGVLYYLKALLGLYSLGPCQNETIKSYVRALFAYYL